MRCICKTLDNNKEELLSTVRWSDIYMLKKVDKYGAQYYIVAKADGCAYMKLNYCPRCGRKLVDDDE